MTTQLAAARARARRDFLRRERDRRRLSIAYPPQPIEEPGEEFPSLLDALKPRMT
jgi:hypothetical protein